MSALKSVIITLPAKGLASSKSTPSIVDKTGASKLNFTTSILMDKIKMENGTAATTQPSKKLALQSSVKHMELGTVVATPVDGLVFKQEAGGNSLAMRGKKRRLDHLTWEEKLQRKKLKNRVAAQTSRDRKKAKLDELEETVRLLRERNEMLVEECTMLRTQNDSLISETRRLKKDNKELMESRDRREEATAPACATCQARVGCTVPALGSAAGWHSTDGTGSDAEPQRQHTPEDPDSLPPLEDLFGELQADDDYIERLEELAESLLREVTAEVETNSAQPNEQSAVKKEDTKKLDDTEEVVGETPSYVEAGTPCGSVTSKQQQQLSLHPTSQSIPESVAAVPTVTLNSSGPIAIAEQIEVKEEPMQDAEMVYGTYDEATNCITIIYPEEDATRLSPHSIPKSQLLHSPSHSYDSMSPASMHSEDVDAVASGKFECSAQHSDGGYESHGSPASNSDVGGGPSNALTDLWHESFSELFPSLA